MWKATCFALWLGLASPWLRAGQSQPPPNFIVILADDLGWGDLRCYQPSSKIPTPALDRLAAEGLRFTDAHAPSSVCTPTRYGLLTGRYAWRTRLKSGVLWGYSPPLIEPSRPTIASVLSTRGYRTACIGKWHLGLEWSSIGTPNFGDLPQPAADPNLINYLEPIRSGPLDLGFHSFFGIPASLDMDPYVTIKDRLVTQVPTYRLAGSKHQRQGGNGFWRDGPAPAGFHPEQVLPTLAREAAAFLRNQTHQRPFFLYCALTAPHDPWVPTETFQGRSQAGAYGDFVTQVDDFVGQLRRVLEVQQLAGNTLIVFTSDNGAHWLETDIQHWHHRANGPWRGMKSDAFEGGHRVPFLVHWPGHIQPGQTTQALIGLTDIFTTFAELARATLPTGAAEDSRSFAKVLRRPRHQSRSDLILHSINGIFAVRSGLWKYIDAPGSGGWTAAQVETPGQLYHLGTDPGERQNLYLQHPKKVQELRTLLTTARKISSFTQRSPAAATLARSDP